MIKLFRNIRKKLLQEGKATGYIKYAVGEIVLVVIGILIALQLNNWNAQHQAEKEELRLLQEMRHNLASDLEDCMWNINKQEELWRSNTAVLNHLEEQSTFHDSLRSHYGNLIYSTTQKRNMSTYDHLKAKGIDLVQNDSLRRNITAVYSERYYYYIEKVELEYDNPYQLQEVVPQLNAKIVLDASSKTGYPINLESLREDDAFKGTLRMNASIRQNMIRRYGRLSEDLEGLIAHIDQELKDRK
jgi:hypothetical protein